MAKTTRITIGTILGVIGFIFPQMLFIYTGQNNYTIWIMPAYLFVIGYFEYPFILGTENDWGFDLLNLNWYFDPSKISTTINFLTDVDFYIQAFETFLYGGDYGHSSMDISGLVFVIAAIFCIVAIILSIGTKNIKLSGIIFMIGGTLSLIALVLTWQNSINSIWIGSFVDNYFMPIPIGSITLLIGGFLNFRTNN